jgi:hypothetical protein
MMSRKNPKLVYHRLAIIASSPTTEIRLGPDAGHLSWSIMKRIFVPQSRRVVVCIEKAHHMKTEQKIVAAGAASGVVTMAVSVWILAKILPTPVIEDALAERLAYVLRANVVALVPFFIMLITVGNSRFLSEAIDPTRRAESRSMEIDGRVADNTLQQNFVFAVASACVGDGYSASLSASRVGMCNCFRVRSSRFLAGLSAQSALSRTRDGGDCIHESRNDPLPAIPYIRRHVTAAPRTCHCESCATHRNILSVLSLWDITRAPPLLTG